MKDQLAPFLLDEIDRVTFFKCDEITTDLICCKIASNGSHWIYHEEMHEWAKLTAELKALPGFAADWFQRVSQPPFKPSEVIAFERIAVETQSAQ